MEKKETWIILLIGIAFLALLFWESAYSAGKDSCAEDIARFCKDIQPGGGRIASCLRTHENELSPPCKASIEEARKKARDWQQACAEEVNKFCRDTKPGGGRILRCLEANEKDLGPPCREKLQEARQRAR